MKTDSLIKLFSVIVIIFIIYFSNFSCNLKPVDSPQTSNKSFNLEKEEPKPFSPREILSNQPDFMAEEVYSEFEERGGFSTVSKIAKKGEYYRLEFENDVSYIKQNLSLISYNETENKFIQIPGFDENKWYRNINFTAIFANNENIEFSEIGTEFILGHNCTKIEAKPKTEQSQKNKEEAIFYVAKDLNNLVIAIQINLLGRIKSYALRNISFNVPEELFKPIENYKP